MFAFSALRLACEFADVEVYLLDLRAHRELTFLPDNPGPE